MDAPGECIACGYSLAGELSRCPECGLLRDDAVRAVERRRREAAAGLGEQVRGFLARSAGVIVVYGLGVLILVSGDIDAAVSAGVAMTVAVAGSAGLGWLLTALAPRRERDPLVSAWLRVQPYVHAPWLLIPVAAVCSVLAAWAEVRGGPAGLHTGVVMAGALVWLLVGGLLLVKGMVRMAEQSSDFGVRAGWAATLLVLAQVGVSLAAAMLGLLGGALAAVGGAEIVGLEWFPG